MPGFARSTVDGFAVRAADTYGATEGLPSYLDLAGAVRMGTAPTVTVSPGACVAIPTGAAFSVPLPSPSALQGSVSRRPLAPHKEPSCRAPVSLR